MEQFKEQQQIAIAVGLPKDSLQKAYENWKESENLSEDDAQNKLSGMPLMAGYSLLDFYNLG